jgi:methionine sulfoxide reductase heme-binding subunit
VSQAGGITSTVSGQWPAPSAAQPATATSIASATATDSASNGQVGHYFWYVSRTAAMMAYVLLFLNLCLGLGVKSAWLSKTLGPKLALDLHQFTALIATALIALHVFALLGVTYMKFSFLQLLVPVNEPYRPLWTALGIIGFYLMLAVVFSFYIRKLIGQPVWRAIHYTAFVLFWGVLLHSVMSGTDTATAWGRWLYVLTGSTAVFLFLWRFFVMEDRPSQAAAPLASRT